MSPGFNLNKNVVDTKLGQILTVPVFLPVTFATLLFENNYFFTFKVLKDRTFY